MKRERYLLLCLFVLAASAVALSWVRRGASGQDGPSGGDLEPRVEAILAGVTDAGPDEEVWRAGRSLEDLGLAAAPALLSKWKGLPLKKEIAVGVALAKLGHSKDVAARAFELIGAEKDRASRTLLIEFLGAALASGGAAEDAERIEKLLDSTFEPQAKIALCRVLGHRWGSVRAKKELKALLESENEEVRIQAALTLAELGDIEPGRRLLRTLEGEPTPRGRLARSLLKEYDLHRILERSAGAGPGKTRFDDAILEEIRLKIKASYVDPSRSAFTDMARRAAEGVVLSLDADCAFVDEKTLDKAGMVNAGILTGVGLAVGISPKKPDDEDARRVPVVIAPLFNGPAALAGIRPMQEIWEIDGESTIGKNIAEVEGMLAGKPGSKVSLRLYHRTWFRERRVTIERRRLQGPEALSEALPGGIVVIKIPAAGMETGKAVAASASEAAGSGAKAVILDLRDNPGGPLEAVADIASLFLDEGVPLYSTRGKDPEMALNRTVTARSKEAVRLPLVVLVNEGTAAAAELLAGALKDAGKAVLVGTETFGKGEISQLVMLKTLASKAGIRLTVGVLSLPKTGEFHGKGLKPDRVVPERRMEIWRHDEIYKVLEAGHVGKYLDQRWAENLALFASLAGNDGFEPGRWPDFEAWFKSTGTKAERDDLRALLRAETRRRLSSGGGKPLVTDLQEDGQMRAAVAEAAKLAGIDLSRHSEYEGLK